MLFRKSRARQSIQRIGISKIFHSCSDYGTTLSDATICVKNKLTKICEIPYDKSLYSWLNSKPIEKPKINDNGNIECEIQHFYIYLHPSQSGWLSKHGFKEYTESVPRQLSLVDSSFDISDMGQVLTKGLMDKEEKDSLENCNYRINPFVLSLKQQIFYLYNLINADGDFLLPFAKCVISKFGQNEFNYLDAGNLIPEVINNILLKFSGLAYTSDHRAQIDDIERMRDSILEDIREQKEKKGSGSRREQECIPRLEWLSDLGILKKIDSRLYVYTDYGKNFIEKASSIYEHYLLIGFADKGIKSFLDNNFFEPLHTCIYPDIKLKETNNLVAFIEQNYKILHGIAGYCLFRPLLLQSNINAIEYKKNEYLEYNHGIELLEKTFKDYPEKIYFTTDRFGEDVQLKFI